MLIVHVRVLTQSDVIESQFFFWFFWFFGFFLFFGEILNSSKSEAFHH